MQLKQLQSQVTNLLATHKANPEDEEVEGSADNECVDVSGLILLINL